MRASVVFAVLATGVAVGVVYALSPLTVWFLCAMALLVRWTGGGLSDRERRWVLTALTAAIVLRVLVIAALFLSADPGQRPVASFFYDGDGLFYKRRSLWLRNIWLDIPVSPGDFVAAFNSLYGWTSYINVMAYLQYLLGPTPYGVHLFNAGLFAAGTVLLFRVVRASYGKPAAFVGLVLVLFMPTLFLWSISALKESLQLFLSAAALTLVMKIVRGRRFVLRLAHAAMLAALAAALTTIRVGMLLVIGAGLMGGALAGMLARRLHACVAILVVLPLLAGYLLMQPDVQERIMTELQQSATMHRGNVRTEGVGYKVLDDRFYFPPNDETSSMTPSEAARFVSRAVVSFVVVPLPWQIQSRVQFVFLPQQILWYVLVILAIPGVLEGMRRDAALTLSLTGYCVLVAAIVALNSGNIGTMVRHRDIIVPFVVWLSALGGVRLVAAAAARANRLWEKPEVAGEEAMTWV